MQKPVVGYAGGVFDLFHVGHVNLLRRAKEKCDLLIAGVSTDELAQTKGSKPFVSFTDRVQIVAACRYVDLVVPQVTFDKVKMWQAHQFDKLFVGSDWQGTESWRYYEIELAKEGVKVIYLPYTEHVSSTMIRKAILDGQDRVY